MTTEYVVKGAAKRVDFTRGESLASYAHSLRISNAEAGYGAGVFPGGPDYALFAHRAIPAKEPPAIYSLRANPGVPKGPAPQEFSLAAAKQPVTAQALRRRWPYRALAAALAVHLAIIALFIARPGQPRQLGLENGVPLNVTIISSADLKRLSSDPFLQDAPPPAPETPPSPPEPQAVPVPPQPPMVPAPPQQQAAPVSQEPPVEEANAAFSPSKSKPVKTTDYDPSGFIEMASAQFSAQLNQAFKAAEARRDTQRSAQPQREATRAAMAAPNVKVMRPGATHVGKSDEFERAVIWALGATVPMGNGKWGTSVVTFVVSETGKVEGLTLIKSAGDNWLDQGALLAVKQARMPVPPAGLPAGDRTFVIRYISDPMLRRR